MIQTIDAKGNVAAFEYDLMGNLTKVTLHRQMVLTENGSLAGYDDAGRVSEWAREAMAALNADGILRGTADTTLSPKDTTTVEQGILLALRAYQKFMV